MGAEPRPVDADVEATRLQRPVGVPGIPGEERVAGVETARREEDGLRPSVEPSNLLFLPAYRRG